MQSAENQCGFSTPGLNYDVEEGTRRSTFCCFFAVADRDTDFWCSARFVASMYIRFLLWMEYLHILVAERSILKFDAEPAVAPLKFLSPGHRCGFTTVQ